MLLKMSDVSNSSQTQYFVSVQSGSFGRKNFVVFRRGCFKPFSLFFGDAGRRNVQSSRLRAEFRGLLGLFQTVVLFR